MSQELNKIKMLLCVFLSCFLINTIGSMRDRIFIVGSSTVFPFATVVSERFGDNSRFKTPIIESTGSGGGIKLFCSGIGLKYPDVVNASRRITVKEFKNCQKKGIKMAEFSIGYDGIVLANSKDVAPFQLTSRQIYLAIAARIPTENCTVTHCEMIKNPYKKWHEIDAVLPDRNIEILGPPPTSGTRDAFQELGMGAGAATYAYLKVLKKRDVRAWKKLVYTIREDGVWVDSGENDNLMINKLLANAQAVGVLGYSFLDQNRNFIHAARIDDVDPTFDNIVEGRYKLVRSLYFYVKQAHLDAVAGIKQYVRVFMRERVFGNRGYLVDKGLIPLSESERKRYRLQARKMKNLTLQDLSM